MQHLPVVKDLFLVTGYLNPQQSMSHAFAKLYDMYLLRVFCV